MIGSLKDWMTKVTLSLNGMIVYKESITSTVTSTDGWAEYIYDTSLGMDGNLNKYIWIAYNKAWNSHVEVQSADPNRLVLRTWTLSSPNGSTVVLQKNTHVTASLLGILKPEFWGGYRIRYYRQSSVKGVA